MKLMLLHGWQAGPKDVAPLADGLRALGHSVFVPDLGRMGGMIKTKHASERLSPIIGARASRGNYDALVGWSNGGRIALEASRWCGPNVWGLVLLSPALDRHEEPGRHLTRCLVYHTTSEWAGVFAKMVPFSIWGSMGRYGYAPFDGFAAADWIENVPIDSGEHNIYNLEAQRFAQDITRRLAGIWGSMGKSIGAETPSLGVPIAGTLEEEEREMHRRDGILSRLRVASDEDVFSTDPAFDDLTKKDLIVFLTDAGVDFDAKMKKAQLLSLAKGR